MLLQIAGITLPIFIIALIGFTYSRAVHPDLSGANRMVVEIALPMLIFTSLSTKDFNLGSAAWFSLAAMLVILLSGALAFPASRLTRTSWRTLLPCVMFVNVGPVGIPLIVLAYGPQGLAPAVILLVLSNLLHFTLGSGVMSGRVDWRMVWANPLVWATVLGVMFSQLQWSLPVWLGTPLTMVGSVLVPMMLLALGARLSSGSLGDVRAGLSSAGVVLACRLAATYLVLAFIPLQNLERGALILFAVMPAAVFNFMLADRYKQEPAKVASMVMAGHFASLGFLPLGLWLAL